MTPLTQIRLTTAAISITLSTFRLYDPTTHLYPTCPIHQYTGLLCPGCGATRALAALTQGHFTEALHLNPFIIAIVLPTCLLYLITANQKHHWPPIPPIAIHTALALTFIFTTARNLHWPYPS